MTEITGPGLATVITAKNKHWKPDCVGHSIPGFGNTFINTDIRGYGELAMYGRNVFMGYLDNEVKTRSTLGANHLVATGDFGYKDDDGFFYIIGRVQGIYDEEKVSCLSVTILP